MRPASTVDVMGRLIYASNMSLDGFTEDRDGGINWNEPNDDVFDSITGVMRTARTYVYGRKMYDTMAVWETDSTLAERSDRTAEYARVWQSADKVVVSTTMGEPSTGRTRVERRFDADAMRAWKAASPDDLLVGGPTLAAAAFRAGLVDECHLWVWPVILGGRLPALPLDLRVALVLVDVERLGSAVHLRYDVR